MFLFAAIFPLKFILLYNLTLGALAFTGAYFGQGIGNHQLGSFLCNGTESNLLQCLHSTMKCAHSNDAGVRCPAGSKYLTTVALKLLYTCHILFRQCCNMH